MDKYGVILFQTSSAAMQAEAILLKADLKVKLIPTPRELSSDCGISLRFDWEFLDKVQSFQENGRLDAVGIYPLPGGER